MTSSVSLSPLIDPCLSGSRIGVSYTYSSSGGEQNRRPESLTHINVGPGSGSLSIWPDYEIPGGSVPQSDINAVNGVLSSLPGSSYDDFASKANRLTQNQRILLLGAINQLLFEYLYDNKTANDPLASQDSVSDAQIFGALSSTLSELLKGSDARHLNIAVCSGFARFMAQVAQDLGFDSYIISGYRHDLAFIRTDDGLVAFTWGKIIMAGTKDFNSAISQFQGFTGEIITQTRITKPDGTFIAEIPTLEGRFISSLVGNYIDTRDIASASARYLGAPDLSAFGPMRGAYIGAAAALSAQGIPEIAGLSFGSQVGDRNFGVYGSIYGFNTQGSYSFGAIDNGYAASLGLLYRESAENEFFEINVGYTRAGLNLYYFGEGEDDRRENTVDVFTFSNTYLRDWNLGPAVFRAGLYQTASVTYLMAEGSEFDLHPFAAIVPQASFIWPPNSPSDHYYIGAAIPLQPVRTPSQAENEEFNLLPSFALMAGGRRGGFEFSGLGQTSSMSDNLELGLGMDNAIKNLDPTLSFSYQWSNIPGFVPESYGISFGLAVPIPGGDELTGTINFMSENWDGEVRDETSLRLRYRF